MKNKEKKQVASQFPNIYRIITEGRVVVKVKKSWFRLSNQPKLKKFLLILSGIVVFATILILTVGIIIFSFKFYKNYVSYQKLSEKRKNLQLQINFWQSVWQKYPGFKDAYFQAAVLEYQLSDLQKAQDYNKKALLLDPNFENAIKLEDVLNKK
jgi:tetratricopeptide (TPR) repeat protein